MKKQNECRYIITDIVAIPIVRINKKSEAYRQVTSDGWGIVYKDQNDILICDEDSHGVLVNSYGKQCCIFPYEELKPKEWFKQAECNVILQGDSCGFSFWEKEKGLVKIYITKDENGNIDNYRITDWTDNIIYDNEELIEFEELSKTDPFSKW